MARAWTLCRTWGLLAMAVVIATTSQQNLPWLFTATSLIGLSLVVGASQWIVIRASRNSLNGLLNFAPFFYRVPLITLGLSVVVLGLLYLYQTPPLWWLLCFVASIAVTASQATLFHRRRILTVVGLVAVVGVLMAMAQSQTTSVPPSNIYTFQTNALIVITALSHHSIVCNRLNRLSLNDSPSRTLASHGLNRLINRY